jgi:hypothetical protein
VKSPGEGFKNVKNGLSMAKNAMLSPFLTLFVIMSELVSDVWVSKSHQDFQKDRDFVKSSA